MKYLIRLKPNLDQYDYTYFLFPNYCREITFYELFDRAIMIMYNRCEKFWRVYRQYRYFDEKHVVFLQTTRINLEILQMLIYRCMNNGNIRQFILCMKLCDFFKIKLGIHRIVSLIEEKNYKGLAIMIKIINHLNRDDINYIMAICLKAPPIFLKLLIPIFDKEMERLGIGMWNIDLLLTAHLDCGELTKSISEINPETLKIFKKFYHRHIEN